MIKKFLLILLFVLSVNAQNNTSVEDNTSIGNNINTENNISIDEENFNESNITSAPKPKVLYVYYEEVPTRVLRGEIFSVTLKTLSTVNNFYELKYKLSSHEGLKVLNFIPYREKRDKFYYDTFYFSALYTGVKLPDFEAFITNGNEDEYKHTTLIGAKLNVVALNPKKNFSNIIANSFKLIEYKTTSFDTSHNIVVFVATANNANISAFKLQGVFKQGIESMSESIIDSRITYFAVINKDIQNFRFTYFNLLENRFKSVNIPIIVNDDSVAAQSDLKPTDHSKQKIKMYVALVAALLLLILIVWRRKYIYSILLLLPIFYMTYMVVPSEDICIKTGSNIYLLPVKNGTIFETTVGVKYLQKEGNVKRFTKVKLQNDKIGWVKNENLCTH